MSVLLAMILVLATILTYFLIQFYRRKTRMTKYVEHLQSPKEYPLVGGGHLFIGKNTEQIMDFALEFMAEMKTPFFVWFGSVLVLVFDHPDDAHKILTSKSCLEKPYIVKYMGFETSVGLTSVDSWKLQRKPLNKAFNPKILESFVPIFNEKVKCLIRHLDGRVNKGDFDITSFMYKCSLDMVCETTLGVDIEAQSGKNGDFLEALNKCMEYVTKRVTNVFYHFEFIYKRSSLFKDFSKYQDILIRLPQKVIDDQKAEYFQNKSTNESGQSTDENDENHHYDTPQTFVRQLLRLYSKGMLNDQNILDNAFFMIAAGSETSALAVSFAILLLAMHPEIQARATAEVDRVFADLQTNQDLDYKNINKFEFLEQILRESLRLNPIFPFIVRWCTEDTKIRDDLTIPADSAIIINLYTMHRRKDIWGENADTFDPDRFSVDQVKKRNPNAYAAFSLGTRNCLGVRYAYLTMKVMLANLLRHYHFKTDLKMSDIRTRIEVTLKNVCGNMVRVERRQHDKNRQ